MCNRKGNDTKFKKLLSKKSRHQCKYDNKNVITTYIDIFEDVRRKEGVAAAERVSRRYLRKHIDKAVIELFINDDAMKAFLKEAEKVGLDIRKYAY